MIGVAVPIDSTYIGGAFCVGDLADEVIAGRDERRVDLKAGAHNQVSEHSGAFVVGVDHFGKDAETGTRGSSAKEGRADTVLASLADRDSPAA